MSISDPIADMLTVIRNGVRAEKAAVIVKRSQLTVAVLKILKKERYIFDFKVLETDTQGTVKVYLQAPEKSPTTRLRRIRVIERISRPGLRVYSEVKKIPYILKGLGICVLSTSKGLMTGAEAKKQRIGGEVLLKVW